MVLVINCVFCFSHHWWVSGVGHKLCLLFQPSLVGQWCWSYTVCSVSAIIGGSVVLVINCVFCFSHHWWVSGVVAVHYPAGHVHRLSHAEKRRRQLRPG